jgi:phosphoglycerate-specific signal transduction histidine kinase
MTDLEKAIEWLEYVKQMKEANLRSYPHRTQDAEAVEHCTVLLDALKENAQLKAELAEYAETFSEQNNALSDNIIANERLKAKLDAVRNLATEETYGTANMSWPKAMHAVLAIIDKDGDTDA